MIRNLKALGLALVAVFAMSALAASASQAAEFKSEKYPVHVHATQSGTHTFTVGERVITCSTATFTSTGETIEGPSQTITLGPTYETCHTVVLGSTWPVTVTPSDPCHYKFHLSTTDVTEPYDGTVDVECTFTIHIYTSAANHTANSPLCTIVVAPQNGKTGIHFSNMAGPPTDVTANATSVGVSFTRTGSALCGPESGTATYAGNTTVTGTSGGVPTGISVG